MGKLAEFKERRRIKKFTKAYMASMEKQAKDVAVLAGEERKTIASLKTQYLELVADFDGKKEELEAEDKKRVEVLVKQSQANNLRSVELDVGFSKLAFELKQFAKQEKKLNELKAELIRGK